VERVSRISAVIADPKDSNLRRVRLGRRTVAVLGAAAAAELGVVEGALWDERLAGAVSHREALDRARREALRSLARSSKSSGQLRAALARRGHAPELVGDVLAVLATEGWLDEERSAQEVASAIRRRGEVPRRALARTLEARGFEESVARRAAAIGAAAGDEELAACAALATKLLARHRAAAAGTSGATGALERRNLRVAAALARRGFDSDIIRRVLSAAGALPSEQSEVEPDEAHTQSPSPLRPGRRRSRRSAEDGPAP
jgi:regulatory protein